MKESLYRDMVEEYHDYDLDVESREKIYQALSRPSNDMRGYTTKEKSRIIAKMVELNMIHSFEDMNKGIGTSKYIMTNQEYTEVRKEEPHQFHCDCPVGEPIPKCQFCGKSKEEHDV